MQNFICVGQFHNPPNLIEVLSILSQNTTFPNFLNQRCCLPTQSYNYGVTTVAFLLNKKAVKQLTVLPRKGKIKFEMCNL